MPTFLWQDLFSCAIKGQMERDSTGVDVKVDALYHAEV